MARTPQPFHRDRVAGILLILALPMLVAGLVTPAISITRMAVFSDTYSIAGAVFAFLDGGRYVLFAIVFFFSLVFPSAKILIALWAWVLAGSAGAAPSSCPRNSNGRKATYKAAPPHAIIPPRYRQAFGLCFNGYFAVVDAMVGWDLLFGSPVGPVPGARRTLAGWRASRRRAGC